MNDTDRAIHSIFEANRLLREAGERLASAEGQTHARRMVLQAARGGATVPDIARKLGLNRQGVQRVADDLASEGLGRYADNPRHQISKLFIVTEKGESVLYKIQLAHADWIERIKAESIGTDWNVFAGELAEVVRILRQQAEVDR